MGFLGSNATEVRWRPGLLAAGSLPRTLLGDHTALPDPLAGFEGGRFTAGKIKKGTVGRKGMVGREGDGRRRKEWE